MENLEEVLQALDEFQKMRPSEIPRELEDYLCWVAKTGDPVYQWPLIKTLFREKLTRVMTEFYESCPSLELAPCPNVDHFNYDTMKSNLLERLESFANAPFTVQRICELLTAPRKEYNRVDKFMRAIEKNILVVSTREPGSVARRSENGDSMVNGSVEDETSVQQPPRDVEMEYWEKDCASTVTISVHTVENDPSLLHAVIPPGPVVKSAFDADNGVQEKLEETNSRSEQTDFVPSPTEFSASANPTSQVQVQESSDNSASRTMPVVSTEPAPIVGDVPEGIMNEDTSSQPSLDLENEDYETPETTRKLPTTFQAKDFASNDSRSPKFYLDNAKVNDKLDQAASSAKTNETSTKGNLETKQEDGTDGATAVPLEERIFKTNHAKAHDKESAETTPMEATDSDESQETDKHAPILDDRAQGSPGPTIRDESEKSTKPSLSDAMETEGRIPDSKDTIQEESTNVTDSTQEKLSVSEEERLTVTEEPKAIVEEPVPEDSAIGTLEKARLEREDLRIVEAGEDEEANVAKSLVPDPIPIVEEPKDEEPSGDSSETIPSTVESIGERSENVDRCQPDSKEPSETPESASVSEQRNDAEADDKLMDNEPTVIENAIRKEQSEPADLMEIDEEESLGIFRQDEPMEQEAMEIPKS